MVITLKNVNILDSFYGCKNVHLDGNRNPGQMSGVRIFITSTHSLYLSQHQYHVDQLSSSHSEFSSLQIPSQSPIPIHINISSTFSSTLNKT